MRASLRIARSRNAPPSRPGAQAVSRVVRGGEPANDGGEAATRSALDAAEHRGTMRKPASDCKISRGAAGERPVADAHSDSLPRTVTARRGIGRRLAEELSAARASATRIATIMKSGRDSMRARTWPESLATDLARNYVPFDGSNLTGKRMTLLSAGSGAALSRVATDAAALNKHATTCHDKAV